MEDGQKVAVWRLLLLSACAGAADLGYAIQASYAVPILQGVGISLKFATVLLSVSPILGMVFQPFLGSVSDQCNSPFGKRKPFVLFFSITAVLGCGASYVTYLNKYSSVHVTFVQAAVVALVALFDFSVGQLQFPTRAFLLDVIPLSQSQTGNFIFTLVILIYTTAGFGLGAVPWSEMFGEGFEIEHQAQTVFGLGAFIIFLSMILTLCSIKEPRIVQSDLASNLDTRQPIIATVDEDEDTPLLQPSSRDAKVHEQDCGMKLDTENSTSFYDNQADTNLASDNASATLTGTATVRTSCCTSCCKCFNIFSVLKTSITDLLFFIYYMSSSMWIVWFMTFFAYFGQFAFSYGLTTFVGTVVYGGDPDASINSEQYYLYSKGVRMGSLALTASAIFGGVVSIGLNYITRWFCSLKTALVFSLGFFVFATLLMIILQEFYFIMIFVMFYGPVLALMLVLPFAVIPIYEVYDYHLAHYYS